MGLTALNSKISEKKGVSAGWSKQESAESDRVTTWVSLKMQLMQTQDMGWQDISGSSNGAAIGKAGPFVRNTVINTSLKYTYLSPLVRVKDIGSQEIRSRASADSIPESGLVQYAFGLLQWSLWAPIRVVGTTKLSANQSNWREIWRQNHGLLTKEVEF